MTTLCFSTFFCQTCLHLVIIDFNDTLPFILSISKRRTRRMTTQMKLPLSIPFIKRITSIVVTSMIGCVVTGQILVVYCFIQEMALGNLYNSCNNQVLVMVIGLDHSTFKWLLQQFKPLYDSYTTGAGQIRKKLTKTKPHTYSVSDYFCLTLVWFRHKD